MYERPEVTYNQKFLNTNSALYKMCEKVSENVIKEIPDLYEWFAHERWWKSLTVEERRAILNVEWQYD